MCESMPGVFLGIAIKNGKGTTMRETVLSRTAFVAAAGTALLTLAGCGGQRTQDATGFNDDRPVKDKMNAGATSGDSGDAGGGADTDGSSTDAFDTWSDDCWDAHRNISIAALLELKGWQLQEFASQQGYTWQDSLEMYENEAGRVLSVCNISKDGATEWLGEDEIGKLDKGGTGSTVMFTLQLAGYSSCEDVIAGFSVPVEDRAQITSGSWIACVYGSNMARHVAMVSPMENGDYRLDLITEEAIKTGTFTQGGGAPTIDEFWQEKTGRALG